MEMILETAVRGLGVGALYGVSSYLKTTDAKDEEQLEDIDWWKLGRTVAIGGCLGIAAGLMNTPIETVEETAMLGFSTLLVDNTIKFLKRKVAPRF